MQSLGVSASQGLARGAIGAAARSPAGGAVSRVRAGLQGRRSAGCCLAQRAAAGQRGATEQGASHRSKTPTALLVHSPEHRAFPLSRSLVKPADAPSAPLALSTGRPRGVIPRPCSEGRGVWVWPEPGLRAPWAQLKSWVLTGILRWVWAQGGHTSWLGDAVPVGGPPLA